MIEITKLPEVHLSARIEDWKSCATGGKTLIDEMLDVQNKCNYFPPQFIIDSYPGEEDGEILTPKNLNENEYKNETEL